MHTPDASKMMLEWLGDRYDDTLCLRSSEIIDLGVTAALKEGLTIPGFGGKLKTIEMGEAIAQKIMEMKI